MRRKVLLSCVSTREFVWGRKSQHLTVFLYLSTSILLPCFYQQEVIFAKAPDIQHYREQSECVCLSHWSILTTVWSIDLYSCHGGTLVNLAVKWKPVQLLCIHDITATL